MGAKAIKFPSAIPPSHYGEVEEKKKRKAIKSKKKEVDDYSKVNTKYSEALDKFSDICLEDVQTNLDLLKALRKTLIATLGTARGAFKVKPSPSNVYALTRCISDIQNLTKAIEEALDFEELANLVFEEVMKPFLDRSLLDLGSHIKDALEKYAGDDEKRYKRLEKPMTEAYRNYGAALGNKVPGMQARLRKAILKHVR